MGTWAVSSTVTVFGSPSVQLNPSCRSQSTVTLWVTLAAGTPLIGFSPPDSEPYFMAAAVAFAAIGRIGHRELSGAAGGGGIRGCLQRLLDAVGVTEIDDESRRR